MSLVEEASGSFSLEYQGGYSPLLECNIITVCMWLKFELNSAWAFSPSAEGSLQFKPVIGWHGCSKALLPAGRRDVGPLPRLVGSTGPSLPTRETEGTGIGFDKKCVTLVTWAGKVISSVQCLCSSPMSLLNTLVTAQILPQGCGALDYC